VGHDFISHDGLGICMRLDFLNDPKTGGHKDYALFFCEKCLKKFKRETQESKKIWKRGYE
jgi:hypothetical protein